MDLRRERPDLVRHPNRPDQPERIRPKCDIEVWDDSDTVTIHHLTRAEAMRIIRLSITDVRLYSLGYVLSRMYGIDMEDFAA